ncbi:excisionase [Rhizobium lemnae]|uniref:Excisionase n=1 Tax=Rhizobium lemnae TaxID=1214924 RepID=A0ABV8E8L7_9HYPH|nr:excisionase [Rhizobium lemnae]MCJ8509523.1 excisionase [Rhizobium lemnae]
MDSIEKVAPDQPIRLAVAAKLAFPDGSMTASGLRCEFKKGNLAVELIANKQYTTLNSINEMRAKCRENQKARASTGESRAQAGLDNGLSSTERLSAAQAAASMIAQKLKSHSKDI